MNISSSSYDSTLIQQMQQTQRKEPPSATKIASEVMELNDIDGDSLLSHEELGISEESFSSMDSDGDGNLSGEELASSLSSMLDSMKNQKTSPEQFGQLLSDMGLEIPSPPGQKGSPNTLQMASDIFSQNDTDNDGLLTLSELGIDEDLFSSIDEDGDGNITQNELAQGLTALFESVESGEKSKDEAGEVLSQLGIEKPQGGGGGGGGGSSEEEYEDADTNQDGTVSAAEYEAYYNSDTKDNMEDYTMKLVSTLLDALKAEAEENGTKDNTDLSKFKQMMTMVNEQTQDSKTSEMLDNFISQI